MATRRHGAGDMAAVVDLSAPDAVTVARTGYKIVDLADENGSENENGMRRTHSSSSSSSNSSSNSSSSSTKRIVTPTTPGRAMDVVTSDDDENNDEDDGEHDMHENIHYDYSLNMELKGTAGGSSFTGELNVQDITGENAHEVVDTECCLALDAD
jgi:hypothetical protein